DCDKTILTPSPALRDAFLQSGALLLPPGCLPQRVQELRFHRASAPGTRVHCHCRLAPKTDAGFVVEYAVFGADGELLETMTGLVLQSPNVQAHDPRRVPMPIPAARIT